MTKIETPDWPLPPGVRSAFTTRSGGASQGPFFSMNLASHVGDDQVAVQTNRDLMSRSLGLPVNRFWMNQSHSNLVRDVSEAPPSEDVPADALYSRTADQVLSVMVADCLPILLCASSGREIAVVHAGWRGLASGIIGKTLDRFQNAEILAWVGPAIGPCHYEVDHPVRDCFEVTDAFTDGSDAEHWMMDLRVEATRQLSHGGVQHVYGAGVCTFCDERYYSYRRDGPTGRMAAVIWRTGEPG